MDEQLALILQRLRAGPEAIYGDRLDRVLLYGSRARGDAEPDVDVLVMPGGDVDPIAEIHRTEYLVADLSLENDLVLSCTFLSIEGFEDEADLFLRNVKHNAIPV